MMEFSTKLKTASPHLDERIFEIEGLVFGLVRKSELSSILTYRFFSSVTPISQDSNTLELLFEKRSEEDSCEVGAFENVKGLGVVVDFEAKRSIEVFFKTNSWKSCFTISAPLRFLPSKGNIHFNLHYFSEGLEEVRVDLKSLTLFEKKHQFDVEDDILVSAELSEEIFEKVNTFGEILNNDKDSLSEVFSAVTNVEEQGLNLEVYAFDLLKGTRRLQEFMLDLLNKQKSSSPIDIPTMKRIRERIAALEAMQDEFFGRFLKIREILKSKSVIKQTFANLNSILEAGKKLNSAVDSPAFHGLVTQSEHMIEILSKADLSHILEDVAGIRGFDPKKTGGLGIFIALLASVIALVFGVLITAKIRKLESSSIF